MLTVPCNLCGSSERRQIFPSTLDEADANPGAAFLCTHPGYGRHFAIVQCRQCGLVYANPRFDDDEILQHYGAAQDPLYLEERRGRELTFQRHLAPLLNVYGHWPAASERLLDVGCYIGVFVEVAGEAGWNAMGIEPSSWGTAEARKRGLNVIQGTLANSGLAADSFDVVTMWDVIEHVTDPMEVLRQAHNVLRSDGLLVLHTMDIGSPFARLMGRRWPWLMEMHLYYFDRKTLRAMLEKAGFRLVRAEAQGRYLRLGYLVTRVRPYSRMAAGVLNWLIERLGWRETAVPINMGDLFTAYAQKVA